MAPTRIVSDTARILRLALLCLLLAGTAACGNKGPLYLPETAPETTPAATAPQAEDERGDDEAEREESRP